MNVTLRLMRESSLQLEIPRPHIAILHYTALPVVGGVENVIAEHARLLHAANYPVTLIAGRGGDDPALNCARVMRVPELDSEHPDNLRIRAALEQSRVPADFAALQARIEAQLVNITAGTDILIVHNALNFHFNLPLTAALYHLLENRVIPRMVAWCHDISRYVNPSSGAAQKSGFPWDLLRALRSEITYVAVSQRRKRMLAETLGCPPDRIRVIPNGVSPETLLGLGELGRRIFTDFGLIHRDLILLMPVRITQAKNIELALRVTAALKAVGLEPLLLVSGPPDPHAPAGMAYADELNALRRALHVEREAAFLYETYPSLDLPSVSELYRMADVIFLPSHREGFGLPVLEGGLIGKAVFASDVPAVEEVATESVYRIALDDSPELVAAQLLRFTQENPNYQLTRSVRKQFTWHAVFERSIEPLIAEFKP